MRLKRWSLSRLHENAAQQVRGHAARAADSLIQSGPLRRNPARIFDNQVEHASREKTMKFWFDHSHNVMFRAEFSSSAETRLLIPDLRPGIESIVRFQTRV